MVTAGSFDAEMGLMGDKRGAKDEINALEIEEGAAPRRIAKTSTTGRVRMAASATLRYGSKVMRSLTSASGRSCASTGSR